METDDDGSMMKERRMSEGDGDGEDGDGDGRLSVVGGRCRGSSRMDRGTRKEGRDRRRVVGTKVVRY